MNSIHSSHNLMIFFFYQKIKITKRWKWNRNENTSFIYYSLGSTADDRKFRISIIFLQLSFYVYTMVRYMNDCMHVARIHSKLIII